MSVLYLIESAEEGLFKIGFTASPVRRIRDLRRLPDGAGRTDTTLFYKHRVPVKGRIGDFGYWLEQAVHRHFAEHRVNGEWFRLSRLAVLEFPPDGGADPCRSDTRAAASVAGPRSAGMIRVCAWCRREGRPCVIGETPPYADTHLTHGVCAAHDTTLRTVAPQRGPVPKADRDD